MGTRAETTRKEKAILKFIEEQVKENGYPPSVREIGKAVGLSSTATVHTYIAKLKEKGYIAKEDQKGRTLKLLKGGKHHSNLLSDLSVGSFHKQIKGARTKLDWLSYNKENVDNCISLANSH